MLVLTLARQAIQMYIVMHSLNPAVLPVAYCAVFVCSTTDYRSRLGCASCHPVLAFMSPCGITSLCIFCERSGLPQTQNPR